MMTGTVTYWGKNNRRRIRPDKPVGDPFIRFSKRWLMTENYQSQRGDRVWFGLSAGASKQIRYGTYVAEIEEPVVRVPKALTRKWCFRPQSRFAPQARLTRAAARDCVLRAAVSISRRIS